MIHLREPEWTGDDAVTLRTFLESRSGQRFLARLDWMTPSYPVVVESTSRLVHSGVIEGYGKCQEDIASLSAPVKKEDDNAGGTLYPDLDGPAELWSSVDKAVEAEGSK